MKKPTIETEQLRYSVFVVVSGGDETPVDMDFQYIDDAEEAMGKLVDRYLVDKDIDDVEIGIYDHYANEPVEVWSKMSEDELLEELSKV